MYDKFKTILTQLEYFSDWDKVNLDKISPENQDKIYELYVLRCVVLQRDSFKCQNLDCDSPESKLTIHHIKFRKNNGKDSPRNCLVMCRSCHSGFHRGKETLKFWGHTWRIHKNEAISPKQLKFLGARIRKENKHLFKGYKVSWEMLALIMRYIFDVDYNTLSTGNEVYETEENESDDVE
jgi:hypothetical protein